MRKTNIFYGNQFVTSFNCDGKRYTKLQLYGFLAKEMTKKCIKIAAIFVCAGWVFTGGVFVAKASIAPQTLWAKEIVEVPVKEIPPVMKRIAKCESKGLHYWDGQVVVRANTNKTVDIGKYQINSIWNDTASKMGLDLTKESDNEAFAMYIYENFGTEPWKYSRHCWQ